MWFVTVGLLTLPAAAVAGAFMLKGERRVPSTLIATLTGSFLIIAAVLVFAPTGTPGNTEPEAPFHIKLAWAALAALIFTDLIAVASLAFWDSRRDH